MATLPTKKSSNNRQTTISSKFNVVCAIHGSANIQITSSIQDHSRVYSSDIHKLIVLTCVFIETGCIYMSRNVLFVGYEFPFVTPSTCLPQTLEEPSITTFPIVTLVPPRPYRIARSQSPMCSGPTPTVSGMNSQPHSLSQSPCLLQRLNLPPPTQQAL